MNVRTICLAILANGDTTGYEIRKQSLDGDFSYFVDASYGSIYPALARLQADGLVTVREEAKPGKPARKVYSITEAGRAELLSALHEPIAPDLFRSPFLLVAVFAPLVGPERIRAVIDAQIAYLKNEIAQMEEICNKPGAICADATGATRWAVDFGLHCVGNKLAYIEANRGRLEEIAAAAQKTRPARPDAAE